MLEPHEPIAPSFAQVDNLMVPVNHITAQARLRIDPNSALCNSTPSLLHRIEMSSDILDNLAISQFSSQIEVFLLPARSAPIRA